MILKSDAANIRNISRRPVWSCEDFADAVVRLDKQIRECAEDGRDVISAVFNPKHVKALVAILHEHGFAEAKVNHLDDFRIDISW